MHKTFRRFLAVALAAAVMTTSGAATVLAEETQTTDVQVEETVDSEEPQLMADEASADEAQAEEGTLSEEAGEEEVSEETETDVLSNAEESAEPESQEVQAPVNEVVEEELTEEVSDLIVTEEETELETALDASLAVSEADPTVELDTEAVEEYEEYLEAMNASLSSFEEGNVTYTFTSSTGLLKITGSGAADTTKLRGSSEIKTVKFGSGITAVGKQLFEGCDAIESVTLSGTVKEIGALAFSGCTSLTTINDHKVTTFGAGAFLNCTSLTTMTLSDSLTTFPASFLDGCESLTSITMPSALTTIGAMAFEGCSGLKKISLPSTVTTIGSGAFALCAGLTSFAIPSKVTKICDRTFEGCTGLTALKIPYNVVTIANRAFMNCSNLKKVYLAASVTTISSTYNDGHGDIYSPKWSPFYGVNSACKIYCKTTPSCASKASCKYWNYYSDSDQLTVVASSNVRRSGDNVYATAAKTASAAFSSGADEAVLCSGSGYLTSILASGYAGVRNCPIILTDPNTLSSETKTLLASTWSKKVKKITIIGSGISDAVQNALKTQCGVEEITVISATNRYKVAVNVCKQGNFDTSGGCFVVSGSNYMDGLSASAWAYSLKMPIIYCSENGLTDAAWNQVSKFSKVYVVGDESSVNDSRFASISGKIKRITAQKSYNNSIALAKVFNTVAKTNNVIFVSGDHMTDALTASCLSGQKNSAPVIFVNSINVTTVQKYITSKYAKTYTSKRWFLGTKTYLSSATAKAIASAF